MLPVPPAVTIVVPLSSFIVNVVPFTIVSTKYIVPSTRIFASNEVPLNSTVALTSNPVVSSTVISLGAPTVVAVARVTANGNVILLEILCICETTCEELTVIT